jgi:hypothetical protein
MLWERAVLADCSFFVVFDCGLVGQGFAEADSFAALWNDNKKQATATADPLRG